MVLGCTGAGDSVQGVRVRVRITDITGRAHLHILEQPVVCARLVEVVEAPEGFEHVPDVMGEQFLK